MTKSKIFIAAIFAVLTLNTCAAKYETIRGRLGADQSPDNNNNDDLIENTLKPTANVEVIFEGNVVTSVPVGSSFTVQPTEDTRDSNLEPKAGCRNIGIQSATYALADKDPQTVQRAEECGPLAINSSYAKEGEYLVSLMVEDSNGDHAEASMTLSVYNDKNGNGIQDEDEKTDSIASFRISATPLVAKINQQIVFGAYCDNVSGKLIGWNFRDGGLGQGEAITHTYSKLGTYLVEATCRGDNDKELKASLTISVKSDVDGSDNDDSKTSTETDTNTQTSTDTTTDTGTDTSTDTNVDDNDTDTSTDIDDDGGKGAGNPTQSGGNTPSQK